MTRRDYEDIARVFAKTMPLSEDRYGQWADDVIAMSDMLEASNPRFDRQRFQFACASATGSLTFDLQTARILKSKETK